MITGQRWLSAANVIWIAAMVAAGCGGGGGGGGNSTVSFRSSDGMFSGGLLFHSSQVPPLYAMLSIADVYGEDGIGDLIMVARERRPDGFGEGAFLSAGLPGGGFGEPMELGQRALDSPGIADFDDDGLMDMVFARFEVEVYFGNGDGTYSVVEIGSLTDARVRTPLVADFDNDGDVDFAVGLDDRSFLNEDGVRMYINRGDGTFESAFTATSGVPFLARPAADFDENGVLDLVALIDNLTLAVLFGDGDGTFGAPVPLESADFSFLNGTVVGDVNGDSLPDIVTLNAPPIFFSGQAAVYISFLGRGDGTFDEVRTTAASLVVASSATVLDDVTGDGLPDFVVNGGDPFGPQGTLLLVGNGDGTFEPEPIQLNTGVVLSSITGDFTGDGIKDIYGRGLIEGLGGGAFFKDPVIEPEVTAQWVTAADIYGDGVMDFVYGTTTQLQMLLPNGDGTFTRSVPASLPAEASGVSSILPLSKAIGDLNDDGLTDVLLLAPSVGSGRGAVPVTGPATIIAALIQPDSTVAFQVTASGPPVGLIGDLVDLDGDGALDMVGREFEIFPFGSEIPERAAWAAFGNGDGTFGPGVQITTGPVIAVPVAADLDGDGRPSLLAGRADAALLDIYTVDSAGNPSLSETLTIRDRRYVIAVGRLDSDNRDDFVLFERIPGGAMALTIYYGNASNSVDVGQQINLGGDRSAKFVTIEDLDGDGVPYIVADVSVRGSIVNRKTSWVLRRTGSRQFSLAPIVRSLVGILPGSVVDDFNLDGQPDIVTISANTLQVLRGLGQGEFDSPLYFDVDPAEGGYPSNIDFDFHGDFDSDGDLDVAVFRTSPQEITLKMNGVIRN